MKNVTLRDGTTVPVENVTLPDGEPGYEFTLLDGSAKVQLRSTPPLASIDVIANNSDVQYPPRPWVENKSVTGEVIRLPARPGEVEYAQWEQDKEEVDRLRLQLQEDFTWDYGVVQWQRPIGEKWVTDPAKGWKFPEILRAYGSTPRKGAHGKRVDFIRYTLFANGNNLEVAQILIYGLDTTPLTEQEVDAAADMFPSD